jgi:hypothetical protein
VCRQKFRTFTLSLSTRLYIGGSCGIYFTKPKIITMKSLDISKIF